MEKLIVTTTQNQFTVECESFNQSERGFDQTPCVTFYNTKANEEKDIRAWVTADQLVSVVRE